MSNGKNWGVFRKVVLPERLLMFTSRHDITYRKTWIFTQILGYLFNRIYYSETRSFVLKLDTKCISGLNGLTQNLAPMALFGTCLFRNLTLSPDTLTRVDSVVTMANILISCLLTNLLIPWNSALLKELTVSQPVKIFPKFYGTRRFINAFTRARPLPLFWATSIQYMPPNSVS